MNNIKVLILCLAMLPSLCMGESIRAGQRELIIAATIWHEARGERLIGKRAVATVIYNRHIERGLTLSQVCRQSKQFSCWNGKRARDLLLPVPTGKAWRQCLWIAIQMTTGRFKPVNRANHYFAYKLCNPKWKEKMEFVERIGGHDFYYGK